MHRKSILQNIINNLVSCQLLLPEILIATTLSIILTLTFLLPRYQRYWLFPVAFTGTSLAWYAKYWLGSHLNLRPAQSLFNQLLILDPLAIFFCLLLLSITLLLLLSAPQRIYPLDTAYKPTYIMLLLGTLLGSCLLVMASHWLTIYLSLTLLSLAFSLLIGIHKTPHSTEASLKYLLYSMASTAVMLWGVAHFYGLTRTLSLSDPNLENVLQTIPAYIVLSILSLCLSSLLLAFAAFPYHFWVPDVYQGAPNTVVAHLSIIPKLATVAVFLRLFHQLLPQLGAMLQEQIRDGVAVLALLTIIVGNITALLQKNCQRLMAYGSIAQGGLLMAGIAAFPDSQIGLWYYSAVYGVMGLAIWLGVEMLQDLTGSSHLREYAGLGRKFPWLSGSITFVTLSLVGLPPTAGFTGKFLLFVALWNRLQRTGNSLLLTLLVASLLGTVLSFYYYLRLPYVLFCETAQKAQVTTNVRHANQLTLVGLAFLIFVGFFAADNLLAMLSSWLD